jgi:CheY-like chemotaxis protein
MNPVLYVEDEEDDVFLLRHAFKEAGVANPLLSVPDGEAALEYLSGTGEYANRADHLVPLLLLLDINMPKVSGLEVLKWLRAQPNLRTLPTLILSSSAQDSDIRQAYELGANGYLVKPSALDQLLVLARAIRDFWLIHNHAPQLPRGLEASRAAARGPSANAQATSALGV